MIIDPNEAINYIMKHAKAIGDAKGNVDYLKEYRKTVVAIGFQKSLKKTVAEREADSYTTQEFKTCILGIKEAVAEAERLRWMMIAAQMRGECWRTMEASNRVLERATL